MSNEMKPIPDLTETSEQRHKRREAEAAERREAFIKAGIEGVFEDIVDALSHGDELDDRNAIVVLMHHHAEVISKLDRICQLLEDIRTQTEASLPTQH